MNVRFFGLLGTGFISAALLGCGGSTPPQVSGEPPAAAHAEHDHPAEGPHHGALIELGTEEYHLELTHDEAKHIVGIYVLDSSAKKAVPIEAKELALNLVTKGEPQQFTLAAKPQGDDPAEQASYFELVDEKCCDAVCAKDVKGRVNLKIGEKQFSGEVKAHDHDHAHGHKH